MSLVALLLVILAGCTPAGLMDLAVSDPTSSEAPAPTVTFAPTDPARGVRNLTILYTNDEHGWLLPEAASQGQQVGGAAELMAVWREQEGYTPDGPFLVLSGGDLWTGPAISTWFRGEPMVEEMSMMGYQASAVGNHEFDFGIDTLRKNIAAAAFPFLSANIIERSTGETPEYIRPHAIVVANGIRVGLIGLTTLVTPDITDPAITGQLDFLPYEQALDRAVPELQAQGVDMIAVLAHVCGSEMQTLARHARGLGVDVLTAGHCHERIARVAEGLPLIGGGQNMRSYARLDLSVDLAEGTVTTLGSEVVDNRHAEGVGDQAIAERVAAWDERAQEALGEEIGYTRTGLKFRSPGLSNLIMDAWLWAYPSADLSISNQGGFREGIDAGPITLSDIVNVMPFENTLVDVYITGAEVKQNLDCCGGTLGGMTYVGNIVKLPDGTRLDPSSSFHVLVNNYIAAGGDSYRFAQQDPDAYETSIDWRQPVIDYIRQLHTDQQHPLEDLLDSSARLTS